MKKFKLAVIALLALFALCAAGSLFSSAYAHFQELARQNRLARQAAFRMQENEFQKLRAEHADWKKLPDALRQFRINRIISMDDFAVFRRDLNSRLDNNGFHDASISFQFGASQNRMRKVAIGFTLKGSYRQLKKFIFDMEKSPKMHFFDHIVFTGSGPTVTGGFSMEAYLGE
jgi:Tfp pilus assembly protein PilO